MKECKTFWAKIYIGLKPGYDDCKFDVQVQNKDNVVEECQSYCDDIGLGLTYKENKFIYTNGREYGLEIGLIAYPRFPKSDDEIRILALDLTKKLMKICKQNRVSVMFPDKTIMLEKEDL